MRVSKRIYVLELFHGPTLSFKDVGARFMSRVMSRLLGEEEMTILVATSGDTGSAVAHGFYNVPNIRVILLYPKGKVSKVQEQQFTTLGGNITALAVDGTFDDCQALVKQAFTDQFLRKEVNISSANSINFLRLIAQMSYYLWTYQQLAPKTLTPIHLSVPSGNFGNLTAGKIANKMGIPFGDFVVANNENNVVCNYLEGNPYKPRPSVSTLSNAMDVGNPNNFPRLLHLFNDQRKKMREQCYGYTVKDNDTLRTIRYIYDKQGYLLDPHGAVGYTALEWHLQFREGIGVCLETAHPAKFIDTVETAISKPIDTPQRLATCLTKPKQAIDIPSDYQTLKEFILG